MYSQCKIHIIIHNKLIINFFYIVNIHLLFIYRYITFNKYHIILQEKLIVEKY